ncbi:MAG: sensor histidine kinase, partial [Nocardioidaceae bacterium]
ALVVTAFVGERLAKAALKPVERYRARAADIAAGASGVRLDVPPGREDEITRLGDTLNDMLGALEDALERERRFVDDASHELRTPLTLLRGRVQLALRRGRSTDEYETVLEEVESDVDRLASLTDQLLALQRPAIRGELPSDLVALVLDETERRLTLASPGSFYGREGALRVVASGTAPVDASGTRLAQLLGNLLDNAALHGEAPVTVGVDVAGDTVRLTVTDSGPGMDPETLAVAPQRFARSPGARSRPGSGLGLALVESALVQLDGGLRLCFDGRHETFGHPFALACEHGPRMTVTVLLPRSRAGSRDI